MSLEILVDIIDELRRDRKIKMSISDANYVSTYVKIDTDQEVPEGEEKPAML